MAVLTCQYRAQRRTAFSRRSDDGKELNFSLALYYLNAWDGLCEQKFCCHVIEGGRFDASNISFASSVGASFFAERLAFNVSDTGVASIANTLEQYKVRCLFGKMIHRWWVVLSMVGFASGIRWRESECTHWRRHISLLCTLAYHPTEIALLSAFSVVCYTLGSRFKCRHATLLPRSVA